MTKIIPDKYYSIRETVKIIPWVNCAPTLQKTIDKDIAENRNQTFKAIVLKRNKQKRYYIKGENLIKLLKKSESGELVQNGKRQLDLQASQNQR